MFNVYVNDLTCERSFAHLIGISALVAMWP
jgi:hypothetical protein